MSAVTNVKMKTNSKDKKESFSYFINNRYIPEASEIVIDLDDNNSMKIGDGKTRYNDLEYVMYNGKLR